MKTIYKYPLKANDRQNIELPIGSEILTIQTQHDTTPCLWALVDPEKETEIRTIEIFATGEPIHYDMDVSRKYISTFMLDGGYLVFHAFEYTGI